MYSHHDDITFVSAHPYAACESVSCRELSLIVYMKIIKDMHKHTYTYMWTISYIQLLYVHTYHIAGFVCEVLICANYARCHGLAHFNSTVTFNSAIVLVVSQLCALLYLIWLKCRYLVSRQSLSLHWTANDLCDCDDSTALQSIFSNKTLPVVICILVKVWS